MKVQGNIVGVGTLESSEIGQGCYEGANGGKGDFN